MSVYTYTPQWLRIRVFQARIAQQRWFLLTHVFSYFRFCRKRFRNHRVCASSRVYELEVISGALLLCWPCYRDMFLIVQKYGGVFNALTGSDKDSMSPYNKPWKSRSSNSNAAPSIDLKINLPSLNTARVDKVHNYYEYSKACVDSSLKGNSNRHTTSLALKSLLTWEPYVILLFSF